MKVALFIAFAIAVNVIGYCIAFITGFHIGKGKTESEEDKAK